MQKLQTRSTSTRTAECDPIVLREGDLVRLAFVPTLVENTQNPRAAVDGYFIYQRKARSGRWIPERTVSLSTLKSGEGFKLTLHATELLTLLERPAPLYRFYEHKGVPVGKKTFVEVAPTIADFISRGEEHLADLFNEPRAADTEVLIQLLRRLATDSGVEAISRMMSIAPEHFPRLSALLGIASLRTALTFWKSQQSNASEEFWQKAIEERIYVLGQVFSYPIVVIGTKAYVGGKQITRRSGKEVDFLATTESTDAVILIEIKTPQTKLLSRPYREDIYPLSIELSGAVAQIMKYRQSFTQSFASVTADLSNKLTLGEPRCIVIAGHSSELTNSAMRNSFELMRERIQGNNCDV